MGFPYRILRAHEIVTNELNVRVVNHLLENLAIHLEKGGSQRFGLTHHLTDSPLKQTRLYRALNSQKKAPMPLA